MWLGTKRMERLAKARLFPVSKPRHINSVFTVNVNTPILYIYWCWTMEYPAKITDQTNIVLYGLHLVVGGVIKTG